MYKKSLELPIRWVFLGLLIFLLAVFVYLSWQLIRGIEDGINYLLFSCVTGILSGLVVWFLQFLIKWFELAEVDRVRGLQIRDVLVSRDDEVYYRKVIAKARQRVWVLGVTANRFLDDFASHESPKPEKKVLIDLLNKGVDVRFLLPKKDFLDKEKDKAKFDASQLSLRWLSEQFPETFQVKFFEDRPVESMVVVDDEMLYGPVFRDSSSKDTPTIHASVKGSLSKKYLKHFESKWAAS